MCPRPSRYGRGGCWGGASLGSHFSSRAEATVSRERAAGLPVRWSASCAHPRRQPPPEVRLTLDVDGFAVRLDRQSSASIRVAHDQQGWHAAVVGGSFAELAADR